MLVYVIDMLQRAGVLDQQAESAKYPMMAGVNLVNCIANAKRAS